VLFILAFLFTQLPTVSAGGYQTDYVQYVIVENSTIIEGTIVDNETGSPVGGAGVGGEVHSDIIYVNVQADANGRFRIALPGGEDHTYILNISAPGYDPRTIMGSIKAGESKNLGQIRINYNPFDIVLAETSGGLTRTAGQSWGSKQTTITATPRNGYELLTPAQGYHVRLVVEANGIQTTLGADKLKFSSTVQTSLTMKPLDSVTGSTHPVTVKAYDSNGRLVHTQVYNLSLQTNPASGGGGPPSSDPKVSISVTLRDKNTGAELKLSSEKRIALTSFSYSGTGFIYCGGGAVVGVKPGSGTYTVTASGSYTGYYPGSGSISGTYNATANPLGVPAVGSLSLSNTQLTIYLTPYPGTISGSVADSALYFTKLGETRQTTFTASGNLVGGVIFDKYEKVFIGSSSFPTISPGSAASLPASTKLTAKLNYVIKDSGGNIVNQQFAAVLVSAIGNNLVPDGKGGVYTPSAGAWVRMYQKVEKP